MSTSPIADILDALQESLVSIAGLRGVAIFSAPAGDSATPECIEFGEITVEEVHHAMGGARRIDFRVKGSVIVIRPGAGEKVIRSARDRAFTIYSYLETDVNDDPTIDATCTHSQIVASTVTQGYMPEGRVCQIEWDLSVRSVFNP